MVTTQITNINGYLKQQYEGPIQKLMNKLSVTWSRLDKTRDGIPVDGIDLTAKIPTNYRANQGIGSRAEGGTLPTARVRGHQYMQVASAYHYGAFTVSGQAKAASRAGNSFTKVTTDNMNGMLDELKIEMNRQLWGRGTGSLGRITSNTVVADGATVDVDDASMLSDGMYVDTYTTNAGSAGTLGLDSREIEYVIPQSNKIVFTDDLGAAGEQNGDYIYREDSRGYVMMGLEGIVDGVDHAGAQYITTFQGITRATNPKYQAFVYSAAANRPLERDLIQQAFEAPEFLGSGGTISAIVSKPALRRRYLDLEASERRHVDTMILDGGWSALKYTGGGKPVVWIADQMCPSGSIYFLGEEQISVFEAQKFKWMTDEGGGVLRLTDKDEWEAKIAGYMNVGSFRPNTSSVLRAVA